MHNEIQAQITRVFSILSSLGIAMYNAELLEEAKTFMFHMLTKVVEYGGSDLFITADFPPSIKLQGLMRPLGQQALTAEKTKLFA